MNGNILEVMHYGVSFRRYTSFFRKGEIRPVTDLNLTAARNEITAVVGASGSGKSLLAHGIMGILPGNATETGAILYQGEPLTEERIRKLPPGEIALIPQSVSYLDPLMKVGEQVRRLVRRGSPRAVQEQAFERYGLGPETGELYPFQVSGGMARRVLIACAVVQNPCLIIADEPTPGLDEDLVREALEQLLKLKEDGCSVLMITHDLQAARKVSDKIVVFNDGKTLCEIPRRIFSNVEAIRECSPYAADLFDALPENNFAPVPAKQAVKTAHMLEAKSLSFAYADGRHIFTDLDFRLESGEIVGIRGNSGRGKSTLAKLLAGYLRPASGSITLDGKPIPVAGFNPVQLICQHPEKSLDPRWKMGGSIEEAGPVDSETRRAMNIDDELLNRLPRELSGGEQQRFCIARILHPAARFLVADEMTAMLDAITQAQIWTATIGYARKHGIGMAVISHDPALLNRLCDRVVVL